jgi:hypothetical protein
VFVPFFTEASTKGGVHMKIQIKTVESIKATRPHPDPEAGGA